MPVHKIGTEEFLALSAQHPVFDVRSPSEFSHAHIPQAHNLPLFDDDQRKVVGTTYKQTGKSQAIKIGLDYFGVKMRKMVEEVESLIDDHRRMTEKLPQTNEPTATNIVLVHCWRGGMRSAAVAWLLDLYGYKVYTLSQGYKAFRNWALKQFDKPYEFNILGGFTGSGKTIVLEQLKRSGRQIINLEALANHKGSAFGALGENPQPSQEMFENLLALQLFFKASSPVIAEARLDENAGRNLEPAVWLEDESQRIGKVQIPEGIWQKMRDSRIIFIDIPFEQRLNYLVATYGILDKENLLSAIMRIQKKLGGLETKIAADYLVHNNIAQCFSILLKYYDKCYTKALQNRNNLDKLLQKIPCATVGVDNATLVSYYANEQMQILH